MPNWCENHLQVTGPEDELEEFLQSATGDEPIDFSKLRPQPNLSAFGEAWYGWRITHWGTKWGPSDVEALVREPGCATFELVTAWSPPEALIDWCSSLWPHLRFTLSYAEGGNDFAGQTVFEGGRVMEERSGDYTDTCEPAAGEDADWIRRGPLEQVCAELALDPQAMALNHAADLLAVSHGAIAGDPANPETILSRADLDELAGAAARRGHHRFVSALVPRLTVTDAVTLAQIAANSLSSTGGTLRALCEADDEAVATVGKFFDLLGPALTPDVPGRVLWDGVEPPVPAFGEILGQAIAEGRCREWYETVAGLLHEWAAGDVEMLLRTAWSLR